MKIYPSKLTDLHSTHNQEAESFIANWLAGLAGWGILYFPTGKYFPDWDFVLSNQNLKPPAVCRVELKISQKGTVGNFLEVGKTDGSPAGVTASKADVYAMLNVSGPESGKMRLIRTAHLQAYARRNADKQTTIQTKGDKMGSIGVPFSFSDVTIADLMLAEVKFDPGERCFDFSPGHVKVSDFGRAKLYKCLTSDTWYL